MDSFAHDTSRTLLDIRVSWKLVAWIGAAYLGTALVGVWAAYDRSVAWRRFGLLALGVVIIALSIWLARRRGEQVTAAILLGCALLAGGLGLYFLLTFDWMGESVIKFHALHRIGLWIQSHRPAIPFVKSGHSNTAGGALAIVVPLGAGGLVWAWQSARRSIAICAGVSTSIGLVAFVLASSRGAWVGLGIGSVVALGIAFAGRRGARSSKPGRAISTKRAALWIAILFLLAALLFVLGTQAIIETSADSTPAGNSIMTRLIIWQNMMALVSDYPFTGSGLGSTEMVYSTYVLLLHVGYHSHAHNLFLQIAVEQGLLGLLAFVLLAALAMVLSARMASEEDASIATLAALASGVAMLVHGLGDSQLYLSRLAPLVFLPIGLAYAQAAIVDRTQAVRPRSRRRRIIRVAGIAAILILATLLLPSVRSAMQSNWGAVMQARQELSVYTWPAWPIQDELRRSGPVDVDTVMAHYRAALNVDSTNASAHRRLGQIELSLGQYDSACEHLAAALEIAAHERATRQLLGECYAMDGRYDEAVALWQHIDLTQGQMAGRQFWYEYIGEQQRLERITTAWTMLESITEGL